MNRPSPAAAASLERPVDTAGKEGTARAGTERVMLPGKARKLVRPAP